MHIKLDELLISEEMILKDTYDATPKNVYEKAKRSHGKSLKMIKVFLGTVYEIEFSLNHMKMNKEFVSSLRKKILQPEIDVEFYDDCSKSYKIQNCYCQDAKMKKRFFRGDRIYYEDIPLIFVANQSANWINN